MTRCKRRIQPSEREKFRAEPRAFCMFQSSVLYRLSLLSKISLIVHLVGMGMNLTRWGGVALRNKFSLWPYGLPPNTPPSSQLTVPRPVRRRPPLPPARPYNLAKERSYPPYPAQHTSPRLEPPTHSHSPCDTLLRVVDTLLDQLVTAILILQSTTIQLLAARVNDLLINLGRT